MKNYKLPALLLFLLFNTFCNAQEIVNGGFEMLNHNMMPRNWAVYSSNSTVCHVDSVIRHSGRFAVKIDAAVINDQLAKTPFIFANTYGAASLKTIKTIEVTAWLKGEVLPDSAAALFIQDLSGANIIRYYAKSQSGFAWQKLTITFTVNNSKPWYGFYYGLELSKRAKVWFDDVHVKIDGQLINDPLGTFFEPDARQVQWLNKHLSALKSTAITRDHSDLEPVGKLCNQATIVGIGEPTHGTAEALKFKLRLLEYLVTQKGFNTIALEEVIPACDWMNNIINNPKASIKDSLINSPFYKVWQSEEIYNMLTWVRQYNSTQSKKVKFIGIDMEDIGLKTSRKMLSIYGQHNNWLAGQLKLIDTRLNALIGANSRGESQASISQLADSLKFQLAGVARQLDKPGNTGLSQDLFKLQTYIRVCQQWLSTRFYTGERDSLMAANIAFYIKQHPGDKLLIWAHNFHIANNSSAKNMGACLKAMFKNTYVPIGFTSAGGTYTAATDNTQKQWNAFQIEPAYRGTYEYVLSKAKNNYFFLPLNKVPRHNPATQWMNIPMKHLDISYIHAATEDDYKFYGNLNVVFDGVVFYKTTSSNNLYLKVK